MSYYDELVATYGDFFSSYSFLVLIALFVLVGGAGTIILSFVLWVMEGIKDSASLS